MPLGWSNPTPYSDSPEPSIATHDREQHTRRCTQYDPPSADEDVEKLRLQLNHLSLEELEEKESVKWDRDEHVVRKGPNFDVKNTG